MRKFKRLLGAVLLGSMFSGVLYINYIQAGERWVMVLIAYGVYFGIALLLFLISYLIK